MFLQAGDSKKLSTFDFIEHLRAGDYFHYLSIYCLDWSHSGVRRGIKYGLQQGVILRVGQSIG